jgi:hypothetical protein
MRLLTSSARSVVEPLRGTNTRAADLYAWQQLGACQPQRSDQAVLYRSAAASPPSRSQRILGRSDFLPEPRKRPYGDHRKGRESVSEYSRPCIGMYADEVLISARVGRLFRRVSRQEDLASVILAGNANRHRRLGPVRLWWLRAAPAHSEGSYGRRNRQAIAARETRVAARLRAVCTSVICPTIAARRTNEWAGALPGSREDSR